MKIVNLGESNSILNRFVSELRDVNIQKDSLRFRRNIERIGEIMAYEISKDFAYSQKDIQTPLGVAPMNTPDDRIVISTILRAGLPYHQGFLSYLDYAENAFVSAYRKYKDRLNFDIHIEYIASPRLTEKTLIITDPMLATGSSMELAYEALLTKGHPSHIHVASIIASKQAIEYLQRKMPDDKTTIWIAALDDELDDHSYIIPGLGDIPLSELTSEMVEDFLEERRRFGNHRPGSSGLGEETMRHIHRLLQQCLDQAMRDGLIGDNPARAFHYSKPKKVNADVLTPLEMEDYLDAAERLGHLPMFMLALTTGLRQGELIALKWSDLNVKNRTLTISEQRSVERRELIEYGSETRTITLTSEVIDLLIMEHDKHTSSPLMFMHPATLKPYSPQMVRRMHNEIIKEAGLDHIRFTDLRHTCAVLSLRNGMETKELARMLGHYRPTITRQNYEPYLLYTAKKDEDMPKEATQSELQQAANALDNLLKF